MATSLRQILSALSARDVEVLTAPYGLGVLVCVVVILDPADAAEPNPEELVLVIGARGTAALPAVRAAGRGGAAAVAVKEASGLAEAAAEAGIALLDVRAEARWERIEALTRDVIDVARAFEAPRTGEVLGDLFSITQTITTLTGGLVSIEDTAIRVLAGARAGGGGGGRRRRAGRGGRGPERGL